MTIFVRTEQIGSKLHRLLMFKDGKPLGEYERSQAADIARKKAEIQDAEPTLLALFEKHGQLLVRWDGKKREKVVRSNGLKVGVIPKEAWKAPSWQQ